MRTTSWVYRLDIFLSLLLNSWIVFCFADQCPITVDTLETYREWRSGTRFGQFSLTKARRGGRRYLRSGRTLWLGAG
ncbi:hypothetical protein HZ326_17365 [Fusarium oxysporum f. sp. albedinis]|nr:hypothetical protein HZ326_17365 [Fusarium oxysporum f. sp. albedinis]